MSGPAEPLPMFPLGAVLFPHASMPLHVFEPRYRELTRVCLDGDARFGIVLIERGSEVGGGEQRTAVGTRGVITHAAALADGRFMLRVQGEARIAVEEWLPDDPYPQARVSEWPTGAEEPPVATAAALVAAAEQRVRRARAVLAEHGGAPALPPEATFDPADPEVAAWQLCAAAPVTAYDAQRLLTAEATARRLGLLSELMDELELDLQRMHAPE
jgi:Lon protease-like protein